MIMHGMVAEPLVAVDRVLAVDETRVETEKYISGNELIFAGHYPHAPIYPGVFLLETMLQSIWQLARRPRRRAVVRGRQDVTAAVAGTAG